MKKFVININGILFDEETAMVSVLDRGFLYGDSVYEATRTFNGIAFRIDKHLDRLFSSADKIELSPTYTREEIKNLVTQTIQASPYKNLALRIILTRGTNRDLGLNPELATKNTIIVIAKEIADNPASWLTVGVSAVFYQKSSNQKGSLSKTGNYQENVLAYKFASDAHAFEAIMVNPDKEVTEGTTSNIWLIKEGVIKTPALSCGVLDGLSRKTLFEIAVHNALSMQEAILTREDFLSADECFLTSTSRNLVPVTKIDDCMIGTGKPGPKTLELLKSYLEYVSSR